VNPVILEKLVNRNFSSIKYKIILNIHLGTPGQRGTPGEKGERGDNGPQGYPGSVGQAGAPVSFSTTLQERKFSVENRVVMVLMVKLVLREKR
jgi:hypothetical protein